MYNKEDGNIIEQETYNQRIAAEFLELKASINGMNREEVMKNYGVLEDSSEEERADVDHWMEIGTDEKLIVMCYVDFGEDWCNARVSYENVTVLNMKGDNTYQISNMKEHIAAVARHAMENMCDWLNNHGAHNANVYEENGKIAGIEFCLYAKDDQEVVFLADFRDKDIEEVIGEDAFDEWLDEELEELFDGYDVDEEVLRQAQDCRQYGVRRVLESCEDIKVKLAQLVNE